MPKHSKIFTPAVLDRLYQELIPDLGTSWREISKRSGIPETNLASWWFKVKTTARAQAAIHTYHERQASAPKPADELDVGTVEVVTDEHHPYLRDLISQNPDPDVYKITAAEVRKWDAVAGAGEITTLHHGKVRFVADPVAKDLVELKEKLLKDIRGASPSFPKRAQPPSSSGGILLEISPFDVHWGKLGWDEEVGENYDTKIASDRFRQAIEYHAGQAKRAYRNVTRVALILGSDAMHFDTAEFGTTRGTRQDSDTRWHRVFRVIRGEYSWAARLLAREFKGATIELVNVPGNHDELSSFSIAEVLAAEFTGHPSITVDNGPSLRKYLEHGVTLLGFTHGVHERIQNLPGIMATEQREAWGRTQFHEFHIGHRHTKASRNWTAVYENDGAVVRTLPSLSGTDKWHYQMGYVTSRPACEAYAWCYDTGYLGHQSYNVR